MSNLNVSKTAKGIQAVIGKHSPEILTGIGIAGMIMTTVIAVRGTPKALNLIENIRKESDTDKLTRLEIIQATWKCYISAAITGGLSIACLIGASSVNVRHNAALATAYALSESALKEYREKVVESIGERKEQSIRDAVVKSAVERNPVGNHEVIITEKGNTLCYDSISGRYFKSDIDKIKKAVLEINWNLLRESYVSLNDFYYEIGLSNTKFGEDLGWKIEDGHVEVRFSSQLAEDDTPCLALDYTIAPRYDYRSYY